MHIPLRVNPDELNQRDVLYLGGGSQVIEARAIAVNELTREEIEVLLHLTDRRSNKHEKGRFKNNPTEDYVKPLRMSDADDAYDHFGVDLERYLGGDTEVYWLQKTGRNNDQGVRDTVLKFIGHDPKDVKIALHGGHDDPWDPTLYITSHPSVPVNGASRMKSILQSLGLRDSGGMRDLYDRWLRMND